jgi:DNA-binding NtrC family response regulator
MAKVAKNTHIISDTREPSLTCLGVGLKKEVDIDAIQELKVVSASAFSQAFAATIKRAKQEDIIIISMLYAYHDELDKAASILSSSNKNLKITWYASPYEKDLPHNYKGRRANIEDWCHQNNITYEDNTYEKQRTFPAKLKLPRSQSSGIPFDDLKEEDKVQALRCWVQWQQMRAIVAEWDLSKHALEKVLPGLRDPEKIEKDMPRVHKFYINGEANMAGGVYSPGAETEGRRTPNPISAMRRKLYKAAQWNRPVLILGETGTGKENIAWYLYDFFCQEPNAPFIKLNCACFNRELMESELFGHKKGAFTGAITNHQGKIAAAQGGILFLDELHTISPELQARLLRFLESKTYYPIGSNQEEDGSNVRIIAAAQPDKISNISDDLYYRLAKVEIFAPALKEVGYKDRVNIARNMADRLCWEEDVSGEKQITPEDARTMADMFSDPGSTWGQYLQHDSWPGNARQLANSIEQYLFYSEEPVHPGQQTKEAFSDADQEQITPGYEGEGGAGKDFCIKADSPLTLEEVKASYVQWFKRNNPGGKQYKLAQKLDVTVNTFKKYQASK